MKWIPIISRGRYTILQSESDSQFVVAANYDPNEPEDQQWSQGEYFCYWNAERKAEYLADAIDYFRSMTEPDYIFRWRLEELCTKFKDKTIELLKDDGLTEEGIEYELEDFDLSNYEKDWLGLNEMTEEE